MEVRTVPDCSIESKRSDLNGTKDMKECDLPDTWQYGDKYLNERANSGGGVAQLRSIHGRLWIETRYLALK